MWGFTVAKERVTLKDGSTYSREQIEAVHAKINRLVQRGEHVATYVLHLLCNGRRAEALTYPAKYFHVLESFGLVKGRHVSTVVRALVRNAICATCMADVTTTDPFRAAA